MICIQLWHAMIAPSYEMLWLWHIAPRQVEEDLDLDDLFWWKKGVLGLLGPARSSFRLTCIWQTSADSRSDWQHLTTPVTSSPNCPNCPNCPSGTRSLEGSRWHHCSKLGLGKSKGCSSLTLRNWNEQGRHKDLSNLIKYDLY